MEEDVGHSQGKLKAGVMGLEWARAVQCGAACNTFKWPQCDDQSYMS